MGSEKRERTTEVNFLDQQVEVNRVCLTEKWMVEAEKVLRNRKITNVFWRTWDEEYPEEGTGLVMVLDDMTHCYLSSDDEGNSPGALHWSNNEDSGIIPVGVEDLKEHYERMESIRMDRSEVRAMLVK